MRGGSRYADKSEAGVRAGLSMIPLYQEYPSSLRLCGVPDNAQGKGNGDQSHPGE
jgi:hypothetical protein